MKSATPHVTVKKTRVKSSSVLKIHSSADVNVEYSELCDVDALHIVTVGDKEFTVSYRDYKEIPEPQIILFGDDCDELICTTKKLTKTNKINVIKSAFISFMIGKGKMVII